MDWCYHPAGAKEQTWSHHKQDLQVLHTRQDLASRSLPPDPEAEAVLNVMRKALIHSTGRPRDLMLGLQCLQKNFFQTILDQKYLFLKEVPGGQNEHLPCERVIVPDNKYNFTLYLFSSAYLHIHTFHLGIRIHFYSLLQHQEMVIR